MVGGNFRFFCLRGESTTLGGRLCLGGTRGVEDTMIKVPKWQKVFCQPASQPVLEKVSSND